jgi:transcription antitermination factor NusG
MTHAVAKVRAGAEQKFAERLKEADQEAFVPTVTTITRPSGMRFPVKTERPRFPTYLFVKADTIRYLDPVYQDSRFHGFLKIAHQIGFVPDSVVKALRAWDGCEALPEPETARFSPGELVRVLSGVYGDLKGYVEIRNEEVWINGYDITVATHITDLNLLEHYVESAA